MNIENISEFYLEIGKFFLDIAKLIIGGVILASIMNSDTDPLLLIGVGFVFVVLFVGLGLFFISRAKKK